MTFTIIKKGNNNFWHLFNNGAKEVNLSDFQAVLDSVAQTFIIQALNGANIPQTAVGILDIIVIDETDASLEETFANVEALRTRLVELGYTPYLGAVADNITGLIEAGTNVTITGDGTEASPYVISSSGSGGGAVASVNSDTGDVIVDLQSVTDEGNTVVDASHNFSNTSNDKASLISSTVLQFSEGSSDSSAFIALTSLGVTQETAGVYSSIEINHDKIEKSIDSESTRINFNTPTGVGVINVPDVVNSIETFALLSDIPAPITIDATPTDGSSNAVSSNGVFDALATKVSKSDYTPAHSILVQQSGTGTPTALSVGNNTLVGRLSGGGSDIDDLSVSDVRTLLDIDTDLATKVNKSRFIYQPKVSITGVTGETNLCSFKIDGGTYENTDAFKFDFTPFKSVTASGSTWKVYIGLTSGARTNQIMQSAITNTNRIGDVTRRYNIDSGNLDTSVIFTANAQSGLSGINSLNTPISVDMANDLWITITANPTVSTESHGILMVSITPLK
jgi:hypothetical protein